ncbi:50S ribosomal protein L3 [Candidatus Uhrbacteria bacterium]|nr:50S ribosomal protein L3 [Candidatus Uhrbacteria bacterium]
MKFILGVKLDMTQAFDSTGRVQAITRVQAGPCTVTQVKTKEKDGYIAVQMGYGRKKNVSKAQAQALRGIQRVKDTDGFRFLKEFRLDKADAVEKGDIVSANVFSSGDRVQIVGTSKGKGFAGVVKRHGFHGHPTTHGHKDQERMPGAIGAGGVQHVLKGKRMGGRMGGTQVTVKNLEIVGVDPILGVLSLRGAVPGARNSLVILQGEGEVVFEKPNVSESTQPESSHQEQPTSVGSQASEPEQAATQQESTTETVSGQQEQQSSDQQAPAEEKQNVS